MYRTNDWSKSISTSTDKAVEGRMATRTSNLDKPQQKKEVKKKNKGGRRFVTTKGNHPIAILWSPPSVSGMHPLSAVFFYNNNN